MISKQPASPSQPTGTGPKPGEQLKEPLLKPGEKGQDPSKAPADVKVDVAPEKKPEEDDTEPEEKVEGASVTEFKANLALAVRTAVACMICSLSVYLPGVYTQIDPAYSSMVGSMVVVLLIFTVYQTLGNTLMLAYQGATGTLIACIPVHILSALMPKGASGDHYYPPLAHASHCIFVFICMWINIPKNTRMFVLSSHIYFMMEFMNPNSKTEYNKGWDIDYKAYTTTSMITSLIGIFAAILVMIFPRPITAWKASFVSAENTSATLVDTVKMIWKYFQGNQSSVKIVQLEAIVVAMRLKAENMQGNIGAAWWEGFDLFGWGRRRLLLAWHADLLRKFATLLYAMQITVAKEDFGDSHAVVMNAIREDTDNLVEALEALHKELAKVLRCIYSKKRHQERLTPHIEKITECMKKLTATFCKVRQELAPKRKIEPHLQSEAFFCYTLCVASRQAKDFAEKIFTDQVKAPGWFKGWKGAATSMFSPDVMIYDPEYRNFTLRNFISITIAYYVGMYLLDYSGIAAGTIALLISNFSGSALLKNLGRLQGVVLGNMIPHFIRELLGESCDAFQIFSRAVTVFLFEATTNYIYYASPSFGYIGVLCAAFGAPNLVYPCTRHMDAEQFHQVEKAFETTAFRKITETTLAVVIMSAVDTSLERERASSMAKNYLLQALAMLDAAITYSWLPRKANGNLKKPYNQDRLSKYLVADSDMTVNTRPKDMPLKIYTLLNQASALNQEADKEPRYYRSEWNAGFFSELVRLAGVLRADLRLVENVLQGSEGLYNDPFVGLRGLAPFAKCQNDMLATMQDCISLVDKVLKNETGKPMASLVEQLQSLEKCDELDAMPDLIAAINTSGISYPTEPADSLEDDTICRLNVILQIYSATVENMAAMVKVLIKHAAI